MNYFIKSVPYIGVIIMFVFCYCIHIEREIREIRFSDILPFACSLHQCTSQS